jgi:hypothetical protein
VIDGKRHSGNLLLVSPRRFSRLAFLVLLC